MTSIAVIDYGMGNLHSVAKALEHAVPLATIKVTADRQTILNADKVILPGVGAIRDCIGEMQRLELIDVIKRCASNKPFLGICIGMQALMTHSAENNGVTCLDIIPGEVEKFADGLSDHASGEKLKIPHMGWNQVKQQIKHPLWQKIPQDQRFYFVHSYFVVPKEHGPIAGSSVYGHPFTVAMAQENIFATQFHPEKSSDAGLQLFANFINWDGSYNHSS